MQAGSSLGATASASAAHVTPTRSICAKGWMVRAFPGIIESTCSARTRSVGQSGVPCQKGLLLLCARRTGTMAQADDRRPFDKFRSKRFTMCCASTARSSRRIDTERRFVLIRSDLVGADFPAVSSRSLGDDRVRLDLHKRSQDQLGDGSLRSLGRSGPAKLCVGLVPGGEVGPRGSIFASERRSSRGGLCPTKVRKSGSSWLRPSRFRASTCPLKFPSDSAYGGARRGVFANGSTMWHVGCAAV